MTGKAAKTQRASRQRAPRKSAPDADGTDQNVSSNNTWREPSPETAETQPLKAGLYLVATPIGNAADITLRALDVLARADVVACEDTRHSKKLFAIHGIATPLIAYHEHNADKAGPKLIERIKAGDVVALISDAGTPMISDPGYRLVETCVADGLYVTALPGPSSVLTALQLAGLPTDRFLFAGFPPTKSQARETWLRELTHIPATLVFLESPKRLAASLVAMRDTLGARPAAVLREMTKHFEEARRLPLDQLADTYAKGDAPKGEVVVVVGPPNAAPSVSTEDVDALLKAALQNGSVRDASEDVAHATGWAKKRVYARALALKSAQAESETP